MRYALVGKPRWVVSVVVGAVSGAVFGALTAAFLLLQGRSLPSTLISSTVQGVFFALFMGWLLGRLATDLHGPLIPLTTSQRREAVRAAARGPVPADEEVRRAALALVEREQRWNRRSRWLGPAVGGVMTVIAVLLAVSSSPWWFLALLVFVPLACSGPLVLRRGRRRLTVLRGGPG